MFSALPLSRRSARMKSEGIEVGPSQHLEDEDEEVVGKRVKKPHLPVRPTTGNDATPIPSSLVTHGSYAVFVHRCDQRLRF